jgi:multicomponent Na+:H+ antiporter subunit G
MNIILDVASWAFLISGSVMIIIGAIGIIRMPDVFCRMHAAGIIDTSGAGLIIAGLILQAGFTLVAVKLVLIGAFLFFTSPTSTHALAGAAQFGIGIPGTGKKKSSPRKEETEKEKEARPSNT